MEGDEFISSIIFKDYRSSATVTGRCVLHFCQNIEQWTRLMPCTGLIQFTDFEFRNWCVCLPPMYLNQTSRTTLNLRSSFKKKKQITKRTEKRLNGKKMDWKDRRKAYLISHVMLSVRNFHCKIGANFDEPAKIWMSEKKKKNGKKVALFYITSVERTENHTD